MFKTLTKLLSLYGRTSATGVPFDWSVFLPRLISTQTSEPYQVPFFISVTPGLTWEALSHVDAQVLPRDLHVTGIVMYLGSVLDIKIFESSDNPKVQPRFENCIL